MAVTARAVSATRADWPPTRFRLLGQTTTGKPALKFDVVDRRAGAARSVHRQARLLRTLGVGFVVGALALTAAAHTFVASYQQSIDALQAELTQSVARQQNLQISRAELESPVRVLSIAEHELGMVAPGSVSYLAPVNPGPSVAQVGSRVNTVAGIEASRGTGSAKTAHGSKSGLGVTKGSTGGRSRAISPPG